MSAPTATPAKPSTAGRKPIRLQKAKVPPEPAATDPSDRMQTRHSNKSSHPGLAHNAYIQHRRPSSEVQAEKERRRKEAEDAEVLRLKNLELLAAHEDNAQQKQNEYKENFANPSQKPLSLPKPKERVQARAFKDKTSLLDDNAAAIATLMKKIQELEEGANDSNSGEDEGTSEVEVERIDYLDEDEPAQVNSDAGDDAEKPQDYDGEVEVVDVEVTTTASNARQRKRLTTRADVNNARTTFPTTPTAKPSATAIPTPPLQSKKRKGSKNAASQPESKKSKTSGKSTGSAPKTSPPVVIGGLKKKNHNKATSKSKLEEATDSMLQEGQSVGFDDDPQIAQQERQEVESKTQTIVKIKKEPVVLPTGKAARAPGERKFTSKHLPDFIIKNGGDRKTFTPLCKEALGFVHSWSVLDQTLIQGIVDRGWGPNLVVVAATGKDAVSSIANGKGSDMRHEVATGAINIVTAFIKEHWSASPPPLDPDEEIDWVFRNTVDVAMWASWQTRKFSVENGPQLSSFLFAYFVANEDTGKVLERKGMFENELLLRVLAIYYTHVDSIPSNIKRLDGYPFGILELAIQALERALTFYHSGELVIPPKEDGGEFSYSRWGGLPAPDSKGRPKLKANEFHKTIQSLPAAKWESIIAGARRYVRTKRGKEKKSSKKERDDGNKSGEESDDGVMMSDPPEPLVDPVPVSTNDEIIEISSESIMDVEDVNSTEKTLESSEFDIGTGLDIEQDTAMEDSDGDESGNEEGASEDDEAGIDNVVSGEAPGDE
ncbi:hypothetical protein VNI00_003745 [Paramarasmius palmivorus]|uniref:Uncharacterized protein n=1 Tax=Paramarasmius palmivorus TaxID=297713 RepID=A0AAW0DP49_9AGAR